MNWEVIVSIVGLAIAALGTFFGIRRVEPRLRPRSRLKTDLEVLRLLESSKDHNYDTVKSYVDAMIPEVYGLPPQQGRFGPVVQNWFFLILGIIFFSGFGFWTWNLARDGFSWWAIFTGFIALLGLGWIILGFVKTPAPRPSKARTANDKTDQGGGNKQ